MTIEDIKPIIVDVLGCEPEKITMETNLKVDLSADSIDMVQMLVNFEDKFGITIDDDNLVDVTTVGDILTVINQITG